MSELLYIFGQLDKRVRPITFAVRHWAKSVGVTNASPGFWISNFSLTCLVICFLQQLQKPILPPLNQLIQQARPEDARITEENINCTFLRDFTKLTFKTTNTESMEELLFQFFEFYSKMDFSSHALSIHEAKSIIKPDHSPMYIINPMECALNVSKNVSIEECERFRIEVRSAAWMLESSCDQISAKKSNWGILQLFSKGLDQTPTIRPQMFFKPRMIDISNLFTEDQSKSSTKENKITCKNDKIKNVVQNIKKKNNVDVKILKGEQDKTKTRAKKIKFFSFF